MADRILIISEIGAGPPHLGNRERMRNLLIIIRKLGYTIDFAGVSMSDAEMVNTMPLVDRWVYNFKARVSLLHRIRRRLKRIFSSEASLAPSSHRELDHRFNSRWLKQAIALQEREKYTLVLVAYVFHSAFFKAFGSDCVKVLDTHDVFANRREKYKSMGLDYDWFSTDEANERRGLLRADRILAIQGNEARYFRGLIGDAVRVETVGHFVEAKVLAVDVDCGQPVVGFLASGNVLNVNAFNWFVEFVWPKILDAEPHATCLLAGGICGSVKLTDGINSIGFVDDVVEFYKSCAVVVNPMQTGTGLKIKTIEGLAYGKPVVATTVGAEGLESMRGSGLFVHDDVDAFANRCIELLTDSESYHQYAQVTRKGIRNLNSLWRESLIRALS